MTGRVGDCTVQAGGGVTVLQLELAGSVLKFQYL